MPELQLDHVAVAVHSIRDALRLYRDALGGEYLMGGDQGESWRWVQLRFPGGGKAAIAHVEGLGYELVDVNLEDRRWQEAFLRPSKAHGTLIQLAQSSVPDEVARERLQPANVEELLG